MACYNLQNFLKKDQVYLARHSNNFFRIIISEYLTATSNENAKNLLTVEYSINALLR